jgi:hypothetical protein
MVDRSLMDVRTDAPLPKAFFTESGLVALRLLASDRRYMDPQIFARVRTELGLQAKADVTSDPSRQMGQGGEYSTNRQCVRITHRCRPIQAPGPGHST